MKTPENQQYILFGGTFILANKLQLVVDKRVKGLSTKQWFVLRNLSDMPLSPPPTITALAKETDTTRQNVSKILELLRRQGYVELQENTEDQRSQNVFLTEQGKQILAQVAKEAEVFFTELFAEISEEECRVAAGVVLKMVDALYKMQEEQE